MKRVQDRYKSRRCNHTAPLENVECQYAFMRTSYGLYRKLNSQRYLNDDSMF